MKMCKLYRQTVGRTDDAEQVIRKEWALLWIEKKILMRASLEQKGLYYISSKYNSIA